ncbi:hypothetical protein KCU78_g1425, partial [Aureobasidium melanogenum]
MCFGERTTFVCSVEGCTNKHWETKYYAFGADPDSGKCDAGNDLGTCADPWMVYHQEELMCIGCYTRWTEETPAPPPTPETWHPQDHNHSLPILPTYEQFEKATIETERTRAPQLLDQIRDIIRRRNADGLAPENSVNTPNASVPTEATTDANDVLPPPPTTPVRALSRSEIPAAVFEGPLPQALPNDTPLPAYDQVASRGRAPIYSENDLIDIPVNLRTLKRLSDYCYYLRIALSDDLQDQIVGIVDTAYTAMAMPNRYSVLKMQKIADAAQYLEKGFVRLYNKANDRHKIVFQYNTTSATEHQVAEWIAAITRNPENSVRSHARRLTEWIRRLEYELMLGIRFDDFPSTYKLPDVRDQRIMQGENWDETSGTFVEASDTDRLLIADVKRRDTEFPSIYRTNDHYGDKDKPSWRDGTRGPIHADSRRFICVPTAFGVPNPRPLPGPNDPMEVIEVDDDQPREVIDLTADSPGDRMEID